MKNKLKYLTTVSLKRKIETKWFLIANIVLAIIIAAVINIDSIIKSFGGDFDDTTTVYVIDNTDYSFDTLKQQVSSVTSSLGEDSSYSYDVKKYEKNIDELKKEINEEKNTLGIIIDESDNVIDATLMSEAYIDTIEYQLLYQALNSTKISLAISMSDIPQDEISKLSSSININREILDETKNSEDEGMDTIMSTVFPIIILPFFMLTIFLVQMIGAEVNDEKTTRGMEIIISNVSPKVHFFSKVIAGNVFIIFQAILLFVYGGIGLLIRKVLGSGSLFTSLGGDVSSIFDSLVKSEFFSKLAFIIPLTLVLMLITFLAYSLLAGILASMTTNAEDFGQLQTPIMIVSLIGYYLALMAGMFKGALFIRILSYVPLISAILSPSLLVLGQIGIIDIVISIIITIITNYLLIHYGLRIYKVGILNYSSKDLWKKMFKAMKNN